MATIVEQAAVPLADSHPLAATVRMAPHAAGALCFGMLAAAALAVDVPLAGWCRDDVLPGDLVRLLRWTEVFAHGGGVLLVLLTVWTLDPARRRCLPRLAAAAYGAGMLSNCVKLLVSRTRPHILERPPAALETFGAWLPFLPGQVSEGWCHAVQSFPSGHSATAVALALTLSALYPRGRRLFFVFACLASIQRMTAGAHYLSDVLVGAGLGCLMVALLGQGTLGGDWLTRWEQNRPARR